jgi:hypothetical protein
MKDEKPPWHMPRGIVNQKKTASFKKRAEPYPSGPDIPWETSGLQVLGRWHDRDSAELREIATFIDRPPGEANFGRVSRGEVAKDGARGPKSRKHRRGAQIKGPRIQSSRDIAWAYSTHGQETLELYARYSKEAKHRTWAKELEAQLPRLDAYRAVLARRGRNTAEGEEVRRDLIRVLGTIELPRGRKQILANVLGISPKTLSKLLNKAIPAPEPKVE